MYRAILPISAVSTSRLGSSAAGCPSVTVPDGQVARLLQRAVLHGPQHLRLAQQHAGTPQLPPQHSLQLLRRDAAGPSREMIVPRRRIQHAGRHTPASRNMPAALLLQGEQVQQHLDTQPVPHIRQVECLLAGLVVHHPQIQLSVLYPAVHAVYLAPHRQGRAALCHGDGRQLAVLPAEAQLEGDGPEIRHRHLVGDVLHDGAGRLPQPREKDTRNRAPFWS